MGLFGGGQDWRKHQRKGLTQRITTDPVSFAATACMFSCVVASHGMHARKKERTRNTKKKKKKKQQEGWPKRESTGW